MVSRTTNGSKVKTKQVEDKESEQEEERVKCTVMVHLEGQPVRSLSLGDVTPKELGHVHTVVSESFDKMSKRNEFFIVDTEGIGWHFHTAKILLVEVRLG